MGIFAKFVKKSQNPESLSPVNHDNDKKVTPADLMTFSRVPFALLAARKLHTGSKGATIMALAMAASDAEGNIARMIDKRFPESGLGTTEHGKLMDPIADTAGLLTLCGGALLSPNLSRVSKLAIGLVLGQEAHKAAWAAKANSDHKQSTGDQLVLPVSHKGKEAMAEKFTAIILAVASSEVEPGVKNTTLALGAIAFALTGTCRGESARREYIPLVNG